MRLLSASDLLELWESAAPQSPAGRALTLAAVTSEDESGPLTVGERDGRLLELRVAISGDRLDALADCPACDETLELSLSVAELIAASGPTGGKAGELALSRRGWHVRFRVPTAHDLALAASAGDAAGTRLVLLERCVIAASRSDRAMDVGSIPDSLVELIGERIAEADVGAEIDLAVECPSCGHGWAAPLDVGALVWSELDAAATRILDDVDRLARAYGWTESDVLALSPARRRAYLELAG
jgi:hypothetical protein